MSQFQFNEKLCTFWRKFIFTFNHGGVSLRTLRRSDFGIHRQSLPVLTAPAFIELYEISHIYSSTSVYTNKLCCPLPVAMEVTVQSRFVWTCFFEGI